MTVDFFDPTCQEPARTDVVFGLCDDQNGSKAYTDIAEPTKWIATVKNGRAIEVTFTAIDKCVIKDADAPGRGRCDGMLTTAEHLFFVELKNQGKGWISDAIEQLESTVQFFIENNDINAYRHKKVFACNKAHSHFQEIDNERNLSFFRTYKFRIDVQAEIIVI